MRAVFYDLDGTLVKSNIVHTYAYFVRTLPTLRESGFRFMKTLVNIPIYMIIDAWNRKWFNYFFYKNYKGFSQARLRLMGKELVRCSLMPNMYMDARKRIEIAHSQGLFQVIVSGSILEVVQCVGDFLPIDDYITNQLEYENGIATGRLQGSILAGVNKKKALIDYATKKDIDLLGSYAFGDSISDLPMLECVGFPCVVNPDSKLQKIAKQRSWPILAFQ